MAKVIITQDYLEDIADAIREKTGLSDTYKPSEMAPAIMTISGGGGIVPSGTISITSNGTYSVSTYAVADVNVSGSSVVIVDTPDIAGGTIRDITIQEATYLENQKQITIPPTSQTIVPDTGYDGFKSVIVSVIEPKDVNFYDYDGTLLHSYSASEFLMLSSLPENPSHSGLTAQGWNWTLSDAKTYVNKYGGLIIGQLYTTTDGMT